MGFKSFIATTLFGIMLSGGNPNEAGLEEKIVERDSLPYPEFASSYNAEPMGYTASAALGAGRAIGIVRLDEDITFKSYPYELGEGVQVLEGKADINM